MDQAIFVYTTFPDTATGERIGETLVARRLAACVNLIPGMRSVYAWKGEIARGEEVAGLVKTRASLADAVMAAIRADHPYETPVMAVLPLGPIDDATLAWILTETQPLDPVG